MMEAKFPGVEHLAWMFPRVSPTVNFIAQHGMSDVVEVDTNLMGSAAVETTFHQTQSAATGQNAVLSSCFASALCTNGAANRIP
jgi:acyl-CoA thioesterase FadM